MASDAAVLTGDLIASTQAGQAATDRAMALIESVAKAESLHDATDIRFTRFRGDGWQIHCSEPAKVFRLAVLVLATLQSRPELPKTRISAATGPVTFLPETGLASASGEVFSISGRNLDSMARRRLVFESQESAKPWKNALFVYLDWQSGRWSPEQAEAIALTFRHDPPQPGTSAEQLGISRQAFSARLEGAGYVPVWEAERAFRAKPETKP
ncbi:MAG: hypothetical protein V4753_13300 [Pseudomonadota bacterium]